MEFTVADNCNSWASIDAYMRNVVRANDTQWDNDELVCVCACEWRAYFVAFNVTRPHEWVFMFALWRTSSKSHTKSIGMI